EPMDEPTMSVPPSTVGHRAQPGFSITWPQDDSGGAPELPSAEETPRSRGGPDRGGEGSTWTWAPAGAAANAELAAIRGGDSIGPFRLVRGLGRGSFARVFLARQSDLSDRLVVVKISTRATAEPHLLARARHAHIVEVLQQGVVEFARCGAAAVDR